MPAGKKQYIPRHRAHAIHYAIGPRRSVGWRFPSWATIAEQFPVGTLRPDLGGSPPFIIAIVPFDQILVDIRHGPKASQLSGALGTLQRARKHFGKIQPV